VVCDVVGIVVDVEFVVGVALAVGVVVGAGVYACVVVVVVFSDVIVVLEVVVGVVVDVIVAVVVVVAQKYPPSFAVTLNLFENRQVSTNSKHKLLLWAFVFIFYTTQNIGRLTIACYYKMSDGSRIGFY